MTKAEREWFRGRQKGFEEAIAFAKNLLLDMAAAEFKEMRDGEAIKIRGYSESLYKQGMEHMKQLGVE